ncbi:hypothetical protein J5N97_003881 [Dioscorea zingiberensis]|uniref:Methyltransferase type 11 domain-containing protein n=1 Tax=Dioscorea zingiberensis TaxID=325984 RepID=A0A9D5D7I9_9LILI|nr:hypothetical protein J5N97_003881 [Dioscorea zingiberensis]
MNPFDKPSNEATQEELSISATSTRHSQASKNNGGYKKIDTGDARLEQYLGFQRILKKSKPSIQNVILEGILTEYIVQDLNVNPKLPFPDDSFDVITNVVSVDYLTKPIEVFKEMQRILKPGGQAIMSFSNRMFWTKAISIWTSTGDVEHAWIVGAYFHYAGGFEPPVAVDISPNPGRSDPMYIICSRKKFNTA